MRLALRNHPTWRNRAFAMAVGAGVLHGGYLMCASPPTRTLRANTPRSSRASQTDTAGVPAIANKKKPAST